LAKRRGINFTRLGGRRCLFGLAGGRFGGVMNLSPGSLPTVLLATNGKR